MIAETLRLAVRQLAHAVSMEFAPSEHRGCDARLARLKEILLGLTKFELPASHKELKGGSHSTAKKISVMRFFNC